MWWLYVPMRFEDFAVVLIIQEDPDGYRMLNDCHPRLGATGGSSSSAGRGSTIRYASGTRDPDRRDDHLHDARRQGARARGRVAARRCRCTSAAGYGGDPDWTHGQWKGAGFAERVTYDLTDPAVAGRVMFGVIDHVGRASPRVGDDGAEGWGLFEHGAFGRHDPSGFADWFTLAP